MAINVNYLSLKTQTEIQLGEIELFEIYKPPSLYFPYFYLHQKGVTLFAQNWPTLAPYLYSQTVEIIDVNKNKINIFSVYSFSVTNKVVTLTFNDINSLIVITALKEDRDAYFLENSTYLGWNKTFTPKNNITVNNTNFFLINNHYYIDNIIIQNNTASLSISTDYTNTIVTSLLNNISVEFGLYRIPNSQTNVYWSGIKNSYFCNNNNNLLKGLKIRSQMIAHAHDHAHYLSNHTHTMQHSHNMSHQHNMYHLHNYSDVISLAGEIFSGTNYTFYNLYTTNQSSSQSKTTQPSREYTDQPNINVTSEASNIITNTITNNISSNIINETLDYNNDTNSNYLNFVRNSKIIPESYTIYAYIYGEQYIQ